jgi:hypothetical protein
LTRDYEDYLVRLIFGAKVENDPLSVCVSTAYLDFNRTLRGISKVQNGARLHTNSVDVLTESFAELQEILKTPTDQTTFDDWHKEACASLISVYDGSFKVHSGQAQKWINMTLKYFYTLGEERVPGFQGAYQLCHAPLDKIVVDGLVKLGLPPLTSVWSQIDYSEYFDRQKWIRNKFSLVPLDVEFLLWLGKPIGVEHFRRNEQPKEHHPVAAA